MKQFYLWFCAGLMMASCTHSELGDEPQGGSGPVSRVAFSAAIKPQYTLSYTSAEGTDVDLDQIQWPGAADFALDILSAGSVVQSHPAGAIPSELELYVGAYRLRAHSGQDTEAWNVPYLEGTQDFSLSASSTSYNAQLTCGIKSTLVCLVFDENFAKVFSDYTAYLNTDHTKEAWEWRAGEQRVACMRPTDQLLIRVDVTMRANGNKYNYGINPLVDLKAGELNVVRFSMVGGEVSATISSDNGVKVTQKTVQLEADWLATRKTSISATFDPTTVHEHIYGLPYTTPTDVVVRSNVGLKSLKLKASGALATLLGATEVDLRGANQLEAKTGLVLTKAEGAMAYDGRLNFKGCLNTLPVLSGEASEYLFTVEAVDLVGTVASFDTKIKISLPELGVRSVDPAKVWNRYAKVPGVSVTDARVPAEFRETFAFEYAIREGEGAWQSIGKHTGTADIYKGALKPATTYTTAVDLGGGRYVAEASFTTDVEPQIPNGDFEQNWYRPYAGETLDGKDFENPYYEMYPEGATDPWWATNNAATTYNRATTNKNFAQSYPSVQQVSGRNGGYAARIQTVGWGPNSRIRHAKTISGGDDFDDSKEFVSVGKLFVGSYNYTGSATEASGTEVHGHAMSRKPKSVRFYYKFEHIKNGGWEVQVEMLTGGQKMASGSFSSTVARDNFVECVVPLLYDPALLTAQPTEIRLSFVAQNTMPTQAHLGYHEGGDRRGSYKLFGGGKQWVASKDSYFYGNTFYVDDVELVYLQDITDTYTVK